jgi:hypothetical protein
VTLRPRGTPGRLQDRERCRPEGALLAGTSAQVRRVVEGGEKRPLRESIMLVLCGDRTRDLLHNI